MNIRCENCESPLHPEQGFCPTCKHEDAQESCVACGDAFDKENGELTDEGLCACCYEPASDPSHPINMKRWHESRTL